MKDWSADERGELPKDLKRGVLSEDGINTVLIDFFELSTKMKELAKKIR